MDKRGIFFVLAGSVLWGTTGTAQALAPAAAQPLAIGAMRLVLSGLLLALYFQFTSGDWRIEKRDFAPFLVGAACMAAYQVTFFAGVKMTGVAVGTIVGIGSSPVIAGLLGYLFRGERPGKRWGIATLLAIAGCALLAFSKSNAAAGIHVDPLGMLLAVGAGSAYATFSLVSKRLLETQPVEKVMAGTFGLGAVLLSPLLFTQDLRWLAQPNGALVILHLALLATATAYILFGKGLKRIPLAPAVTLSLAEPLTAGTLGVLLLGERLSPQAALGILLIFSGLVVLAGVQIGKRQPLAGHGSLE